MTVHEMDEYAWLTLSHVCECVLPGQLNVCILCQPCPACVAPRCMTCPGLALPCPCPISASLYLVLALPYHGPALALSCPTMALPWRCPAPTLPAFLTCLCASLLHAMLWRIITFYPCCVVKQPRTLQTCCARENV